MTISENTCVNCTKGAMSLESSEYDIIEVITISSSTFENNTSADTSAIYSSMSTRLNLINLNINGNESTLDYGFIGLYNHINSAHLFIFITKCIFDGNTSKTSLGGITIGDSFVT